MVQGQFFQHTSRTRTRLSSKIVETATLQRCLEHPVVTQEKGFFIS